ncbi:hypothetical protein BH11MYX1_BH11MYX1_03450 [soil metagenome]
MRTWLIVLVTAAACGNHTSLLDTAPDGGGKTDALWDLAPDGTEVGIVATPKAIGLVFDAVATAQTLAATPDFAPMRGTAQALIAALLGKADGTPADAGLSAAKGFAMFITSDGVIGVMPVGDRDKFMATKHGTRGATPTDADSLNGNTCKPLRDYYVCATNDKLFDRVGKGSLKGKAAELAGGPGDVELYAPQLPLFGGAPGDLGLSFEIARGQVAARGMWTGQPTGALGVLSGVTAPKIEATNAAGFVAAEISKLTGGLPAAPLAGGVTFETFATSLAGPVSVVIPAGSVDIQITAPLTDVAPASTALAACKDLATILDLTGEQPKDACRFKIPSANTLELEAWVDQAGKALRVGQHRGGVTKATEVALTPIGAELAHGDWTAVFWGRGSMLNLTCVVPSLTEIRPEGSAAIHAISLVNELGVGIKVDAKGLKMRGVIRTVWANPPELAAKIAAISGSDIVTGKANDPAKAIAASAASAPFAADFQAGQGGLMIPAAALGIASAIIVPAIDSLLGGSADDPVPAARDPLDTRMP